jgi:hypothetical protein
VFVGLFASVSASACSGDQNDAHVPVSDLPAWEKEMRDLFDDQINPAAVGLATEGTAPEADPLLRLRAQSAEVVARMKVSTITRGTAGAHTGYVLNLDVGRPLLMPGKLEDDSFELTVGPESPAFGMVQSIEHKLRDMTFIGFVKRFAGEDGPQIHWHLTADSKPVGEAIHEVKVLEELAEQK